MNILDMQGHIINEYAQYTRSFIDIADEKIQSSVNEHLDKKHFWPDPRCCLLAENLARAAQEARDVTPASPKRGKRAAADGQGQLL
jgi:hypothetical protein